MRSYVAGVMICLSLTVAAHAAERPPNVIVIMTDDQGYGDLGCYGSPNIETPNIDRLAAEGMQFTSFYAAPYCGPARAALLTGCYPPRNSLAFNHVPQATTGLHHNEITIAEMLKGAGYATLHVGKWHLGDAKEFLPTKHGFDEYFGLPYSNDMFPWHESIPEQEGEPEGQRAIRERGKYTGSAWKTPPKGTQIGGSFKSFLTPLPLIDGETTVETMPDQSQLTTRYTERAVSFIEKNRERPFFIYLAHTMPHMYLAVSDKFRGKSERGLYGDVIMEIDWSVGQIRATLERLGLDKNTLVVFTSDNGPWLAYGIDGGSAGPLRDGKSSVFEGGMRVPGIFWWPEKIGGGERTGEIAANFDLLPTIAEVTGAKAPTDRVIDGRSLWPLLSGKTTAGPHDAFYYFHGSAPGKANLRAVRDRKWKLFVNRNAKNEWETGELYDLNEDVGEKFDRSKDHPKEVTRLAAVAQKFAEELETQVRPLGRLAEK